MARSEQHSSPVPQWLSHSVAQLLRCGCALCCDYHVRGYIYAAREPINCDPNQQFSNGWQHQQITARSNGPANATDRESEQPSVWVGQAQAMAMAMALTARVAHELWAQRTNVALNAPLACINFSFYKHRSDVLFHRIPGSIRSARWNQRQKSAIYVVNDLTISTYMYT